MTDAGSHKWDIYRLLVDYADALDHRDRERVGRCFAAEARARYSGMDVGPGREEILEFLWEHLTSLRSTHFVGNVQIELAGEDASTDSFVLATHVIDDNGQITLRHRGLRYVDELRQRDGSWEIVKREHIPVWAAEVPGQLL